LPPPCSARGRWPLRASCLPQTSCSPSAARDVEGGRRVARSNILPRAKDHKTIVAPSSASGQSISASAMPAELPVRAPHDPLSRTERDSPRERKYLLTSHAPERTLLILWRRQLACVMAHRFDSGRCWLPLGTWPARRGDIARRRTLLGTRVPRTLGALRIDRRPTDSRRRGTCSGRCRR
jgi:hypothetical protein